MDEHELQQLIFRAPGAQRFTQDSPVLPDVWMEFAQKLDQQVDLLLTPHQDARSGRLAAELRLRLSEERRRWSKAERSRTKRPRRRRLSDLAYTQVSVVTRLYFDELIRVVLPMTPWWKSYIDGDVLETVPQSKAPPALLSELRRYERGESRPRDPQARRIPDELLWMLRVVGTLAYGLRGRRKKVSRFDLTPAQIIGALRWLLEDFPAPVEGDPQVWLVSANRDAEQAVYRSVLGIKADAARRLFEVDCSDLCWAVIDSGIDATHPAFRAKAGDRRQRDNSRVLGAYDFTRVRDLLDLQKLPRLEKQLRKQSEEGGEQRRARALELLELLPKLGAHLEDGREVDWNLLEPFLRITADDPSAMPGNAHGTHVAGILAADWDDPDAELEGRRVVGVCPDLRLYDLRVLRDDGSGDEFMVIAALQFVRHLNAERDTKVIHGCNLSISIRHQVANYACGRTPVCDECERVVASGVVTVAAAGNRGYTRYMTADGLREGYSAISITDPGNAEGVITVGATHRSQPHTYGVSYFSSRGPTGDGRSKPDLVAPGEKVRGPVPQGGDARKDGTSMAAPHVSGAAAMIMARHRELIGEPQRLKMILCETATDLGRERYFQGAGMLDVLRALQAV